jgi:DNA repair protein SbcD/Mre11
MSQRGSKNNIQGRKIRLKIEAGIKENKTMIKVLHTADWHLGKKLQEFSRLEEQKEVLEEIIQIAEREQVDLVLLAGDIFDTYNPSHEAVELLYKSLHKLSNHGRRPIIAISGNHDSTQFIEAPDPLAREMGIFFYGKYDSILRSGKLENGIEVTITDQGFLELKLPKFDFPIRVILAPYANEVLLKTYLGEENRGLEFQNLLEAKWQSLADRYCDDSGVNLFIGHFFFIKEGENPEEEPESEKPILHVGGTQALFTKNIPSTIQYAALGHLHRHFSVTTKPFPVVYSSSPLSYSFSEADQEKKVVIVELEPRKPATYQAITLQSGKPLHRKRFQNLEQTIEWLNNHPNCFVEISLETETAIDADTRRKIMQAHDGIINLIPILNNKENLQRVHLSREDLEMDMVSLFQKFYEAQKLQQPHAEIIDLFKEIIAQTDEI